MPPKTNKIPGFCTNCGQTVKGETAKKAANPAAVFCCECGVRLAQSGTCTNPACIWEGQVPQCR